MHEESTPSRRRAPDTTGPSTGAPEHGLKSLTAREHEVLELVRLGLTNAEIARHLFISEGTVRKHLENAFPKLGVHTRTQAAGVLSVAWSLPQLSPPAPPTKELPRYLTSFVGRRREADRVEELLSRTPLLTLTGIAGVGKTRLCLHVAERLSASFDAGAWFVELAGLDDPSLVPQVLASELGIREQQGYGLLEALMHFLRRKRLLLLLDNCEHLVAACASVATSLLRACPDLRIIATSREPLGVDGEVVYQVPPLSLPDADLPAPSDGLLDSEALQLLVDRAAAARPDFHVTDANMAVIAHICRRLDGIPLAIELAAPLMRTRPLESIAAGLDDRFQMLAGGRRTAVARQQTLQAALDWSHALLTAPERILLRRLAVFAGPFAAEAADEVCAGDYGSASVIDLLGRLVDKSLVVLDGDEGGGYRLLETVRAYGRDRLTDAGELEQMRTRHRDWYLGLVERARRHLFGGPAQADWLERLDHEHANLRAALDWSRAGSVHHDGARDAAAAWLGLAGGLWRFWEIRGHLGEGRGWLEPVLAATGGEVSRTRAHALTGAGVLAFMQGDYAASFRHHQESLELHRQLKDRAALTYALSNLANVAVELQDYETTRRLYEESAELDREYGMEPESEIIALHVADVLNRQGDEPAATKAFEGALERLERLVTAPKAREQPFARWVLGYGLSLYAAALLEQAKLEQARDLALRALFIHRELGDGREGARILTLLADITARQGDTATALSLLQEALATRHGLGDRPGIASTLERFAELTSSFDSESAARLIGAAGALREQMGTPIPVRDRPRHDQLLFMLLESLGSETYQRLLQSGRTSALAEVVQEAAALASAATRPL